MRQLRFDLRQAWRQLKTRPGFASAAIATIAVSVAAVVSVFALLDAVLLDPIDVPHADRVVIVTRAGSDEADLGLPNLAELRETARGFDAIAAVAWPWSLDLERPDSPLHLDAAVVESQYFDAVAVRPMLGRALVAADDVVGAPPVVVLDERFWRRELAGDPTVIGATLRLSGVAATVVGVMPRNTDILDVGVDAYVPAPAFAPWAPTSPGSNNFEVVARFAAGSSLEAARAEIARASGVLVDAKTWSDGKRLDATRAADVLSGPHRAGLWLVFGAAMAVLVLGAINIGALLLVRTSGREREMAVRSAIGAPAARLLGQLVVEGLVLGLIGAVLGLALAAVAFDVLRAFVPEGLPRLSVAAIDANSALLALALGVGASLVASAAPAVHLLRRSSDALRTARSIGSSMRARSLTVFVTVELALAAMLLVTASLFLRSFLALRDVPLGFDPQGVMVGDLVLPENGYDKRPAQSAAVTQIVDRLETTAGVDAAAFVTGQLLSQSGAIGHGLLIEGQIEPDDRRVGARYRPFHGDLFGALDLSLLRGRVPTAADLGGNANVAWVNRRFAETHFGAKDPVGLRIAWNPGELNGNGETRWMTIAGVVDDVRATTLREGDEAAVYAPYLQREDDWIRFGQLVAKVQGDPAARLDVLQEAVTAVDRTVALSTVEPMGARVDAAMARDRFELQAIAAFGGLALLLGLQGVFGVVAFAVEQRRAEIGLRLALGAAPAAATRLVLRDGALQIVAGLLLGLAGALAVGRLLDGLLYGIAGRDPATYAIAMATVALAGFIATWIPARRAARLDPLVALRRD